VIEIQKRFFENGRLAEEASVEKGRFEGVLKRYFENGSLEEERHYRNGIEEGPSRWFYPNGRVKREMNFKNGNLNGEMKAFYENGTLREQWNFKAGKLDGTGFLYYENGVLKSEENFQDDLPIGIARKCYETGTLREEVFYQNGAIERARFFDTEGLLQQDEIRGEGVKTLLPCVILFSKPDCHLCDDVKKTLDEVGRELLFSLQVIDISKDEARYSRYRHEIPVVALNGKEIFKHRVDMKTLREFLKKAQKIEKMF
jgi:antitoxin component YwqK of YwqJK toxin-antitoxin module/glutaredoxin